MGSCLSREEFQIEIPYIQVEDTLADSIYEEIYIYQCYQDCSTIHCQEIKSLDKNEPFIKTCQENTKTTDNENARITATEETITEFCTNVLDYITIPTVQQQSIETNKENYLKNIESVHSENSKNVFEKSPQMINIKQSNIPRILPDISCAKGVCKRTIADDIFSKKIQNLPITLDIYECISLIVTYYQRRDTQRISVGEESQGICCRHGQEFCPQVFDMDAIQLMILDKIYKVIEQSTCLLSVKELYNIHGFRLRYNIEKKV